MNSRVHPKYKTKFRVTNWSANEAGLVQRGDISTLITPAALESWSRMILFGERGLQLAV